MVHLLLLVFGVFLVVLGVVICVLLFLLSMKTRKAMWLVTLPGMVIVALLDIDFVCHLLHLPHPVLPYQKQMIRFIHGALDVAVVPLLLMSLYEFRAKKRGQSAPQR